MRGYGNPAQLRAPQHHDRSGFGYPQSLGNEFGLSRMRETDGIKLLLRHWSSDYPARRTRAREACGYLQGWKRRARPFVARLPGNYWHTIIDVETRQRPVESLCSSRRLIDAYDGAVPPGGQRGCPSQTNKTRHRPPEPTSQ